MLQSYVRQTITQYTLIQCLQISRGDSLLNFSTKFNNTSKSNNLPTADVQSKVRNDLGLDSEGPFVCPSLSKYPEHCMMALIFGSFLIIRRLPRGFI